MNAFFDIGTQGSASLPVVCPVLRKRLSPRYSDWRSQFPRSFYNYLLSRADRIEDEMDEFKEVLLARLKREIFNLLFTEREDSPVGRVR